MADLTITAANVKPSGNATIVYKYLAGESVARGDQVYFDTTASRWKLADTNSATAVARVAEGTVLNDAGADQPVAVQTEGDLTIGAALTAGVAYYLSGTPGKICPVGDLVSGDYPCLIGMAMSATLLALNYQSPGVALA